MCGEDVPLFLGQFFRATIFLCQFFFQFTDAFLARFYQYLHIFLLYVYISSKSQTVFWTRNFRNVQLIPNFLRHPAWL